MLGFFPHFSDQLDILKKFSTQNFPIMPSEDTPVNIRSSIEAYRWWSDQIENASSQTRVRPPLFTNEELSNLPYRRQNQPFVKTRSTWSSSGSSTVTQNSFSIVSSREIERGILQREIGLMETDHQDFKKHAHHNQRMLLNINRALAVNMARF